MTGKTHITAGTLACMALVTYAGYPITCIPLAMLCSILPDADHKNSIISNILPLYLITKHRGILHSFLIPIIILPFSIPASIAYSSHLVLDMLTTSGIKPLYPFSKKKISIGLCTTDSITEKLINILMLITLLYISMKYFLNLDIISLVKNLNIQNIFRNFVP